MYEREKAIIITNNDRVFEAYKDEMQVILKQTYEEVLMQRGICFMTAIFC